MNRIKRLQALQSWLATEDTDAMLITSSDNMYYLCGYTGTFGFLLITERTAAFFTDSRYTLQAKEEVGELAERITLDRLTVENTIAGWCAEQDIAVLGVEAEKITYGFYRKLMRLFGRANIIGYDDAVERLRACKDPDEIELIATAEAIGDAAFEYILDHLKPGARECDVALELEFFMRRQGASGTSFETIVASGVRSAMPHGVASDKIIAAGDLVVLDFGCRYQGYCSDMTRTVVVGAANTEQRRLYDLVLEAQTAVLAALKAGVVGEDMQHIAQTIFDEAGYGAYFGHGLGHSVGLEIHELPRLSRAVKDTIPANTCITVEPGLYVPHVGGVRIEDLVVVTEHGLRNLTNSPKNLIEL